MRTGQIIAIGSGPATPEGFLGRAVKVVHRGGKTVVSTVPATLLEAVPSGTLDLIAKSTGATEARVPPVGRAAAVVTCQGSATGQITQSISFSAGIDLTGSWSRSQGLQSASLTADASANESIKALLAAQGSCRLGKTTVLTFPGPSVQAFVGPVPVVMTSKVTVYLDASASAQAEVITSASAGFSAFTGVGWAKDRSFYPIQAFNPHFGSSPPSVSANADVAANLTPTIDVRLYGVVGPQIALQSGLDFHADVTQNPWWTLTAPVDLTASLDIKALGLSSPTFHVYQNTFPIADAPVRGCAGSSSGCSCITCPAVSVTSPGNQTGAVGTPASLQIQASDTDGGALTYSATGLPAGLSIDASSGLISGSPTVGGSFTVTVIATDASGPLAAVRFSWTISGTGVPPGPKTNVLIYGDGDTSADPNHTAFANLAAALTNAGFTVTTMPGVNSLPANLSSYGQIWQYGAMPESAADEATLETFVQNGGSVFLTGDSGDVTQWANQGVQDILNAVLPSPIAISGDTETSGFLTINQSVIDGLASTPNALTTWSPFDAGALSGVAPANVLAADSSGNAAAAVWDDVGPDGGRMAVVMDLNWAQSAYEDPTTMPGVAQNLAFFLSS